MKRKRSHQRFEEIAQLLAQIPTYRELAKETHYTEPYCRQLVSRLVREIRTKRANVTIHVEHNAES